MQNTNPKQLRAELKDYLELAAKEPVRIQRRTGQNFILMHEDRFNEMQTEIMSLQKRLLGMSEALSGKVTEYQVGDKKRLDRLKRKTQL